MCDILHFCSVHSGSFLSFLDETDRYFASRPEVFAQLGTAGNGSTPSQQQLVNAATSVVGRTVASNSAPKFVSAANKHLKSNAYNSKPPLHTTYDSHVRLKLLPPNTHQPFYCNSLWCPSHSSRPSYQIANMNQNPSHSQSQGVWLQLHLSSPTAMLHPPSDDERPQSQIQIGVIPA